MSLFRYVHPDDRETDAGKAVDAQLRKPMPVASRAQYSARITLPTKSGAMPGTAPPASWPWTSTAKPTSRLIGVVQDITDAQAAGGAPRKPAGRAGPPHQEPAGGRAVGGGPVGPQVDLAGRVPEDLRRRLKSMSSAHDLLSAARWRGATLARIAAAELGGRGAHPDALGRAGLFLTPRAAANPVAGAARTGGQCCEVRRAVDRERQGRGASGGARLPTAASRWNGWRPGGRPATPPATKRALARRCIEDVAGRELGGSGPRSSYRANGGGHRDDPGARVREASGRRPADRAESAPRPSASSRP